MADILEDCAAVSMQCGGARSGYHLPDLTIIYQRPWHRRRAELWSAVATSDVPLWSACEGAAQRQQCAVMEPFVFAKKPLRQQVTAKMLWSHKTALSTPSITTSEGNVTPEPCSCSEEELDAVDTPSSVGFEYHVECTLEDTFLDLTDPSSCNECDAQAAPCSQVFSITSDAGFMEDERSYSESFKNSHATDGGQYQVCVRNTFVDIVEDVLPDILCGCVPPQRPASCPPCQCSFFGEDAEDRSHNEGSAAGMFCTSPCQSECSQDLWEDVDATSVADLLNSLAPSSAVEPLIFDWQGWTEWDNFFALYTEERFMGTGKLPGWWPPMGSFVESLPAGLDALTSIPLEAGFAVESTKEFENVWLLTTETQNARVSPPLPPPPPPPPLRVPLNLADAIEVIALDNEPVMHAFQNEMVGNALVVESQVMKDVEGGENDSEFAGTDSEQDEHLPKLTGAPRAAEELVPCLSTEELPTPGSAGHSEGLCKPCAFLTTGCYRGVECTFCHLCGPDERKKRRREKIAHLRELRRTECLRYSN